MANPLQAIVALAKKGDRRVLIGGAAVIGGGVGLFVYTRHKNSAGNASTPATSVGGSDAGGGGSGGSGSSDLSGLTPSLPNLGDMLSPVPADTGSVLPTLPNIPLPSFDFGGSSLPQLPNTPLPSFDFGGGISNLPQLPAFEPGAGYTGGNYGNDIGAFPTFPGTSQAVVAAMPQEAPSSFSNIVSAIRHEMPNSVSGSTGISHEMSAINQPTTSLFSDIRQLAAQVATPTSIPVSRSRITELAQEIALPSYVNPTRFKEITSQKAGPTINSWAPSKLAAFLASGIQQAATVRAADAAAFAQQVAQRQRDTSALAESYRSGQVTAPTTIPVSQSQIAQLAQNIAGVSSGSEATGRTSSYTAPRKYGGYVATAE